VPNYCNTLHGPTTRASAGIQAQGVRKTTYATPCTPCPTPTPPTC